MTVTRISTGPDGRSFFRDISSAAITDIDLALLPISEVFIRRTRKIADPPFHRPSSAMWVVTVEGFADVVCGDGTSRTFGPGDILWADDTEGEGHQTSDRTEERISLVLRIDPAVDPDSWPVGLRP
jgi:hypothetical protein